MKRSSLALAALAAALTFLALHGCTPATQAPPAARSADAWTFAVLGDTPYNEREEHRFLALIEHVNAEDVAFSVHVGDFKGGGRCSDELFARRREQFDTFAKPLVYTPGDNEWTDCRRAHMGSSDPIDALARLRKVFFAERFSLGRERLATAAQDACLEPPVDGCGCGALPENRAWTVKGVHFVTLNIPGSDNNVGYDAANDAEARCRNEGNRRWLGAAFDRAQASGVRALVVAIQANPWDSRKPVYKDFLAQLETSTERLGKPVLLVHGDTHTYQADAPFRDAAGNRRAWPRRLETYGSPFVGWVKVTVDPAQADPFRFEPRLEAFVPPS